MLEHSDVGALGVVLNRPSEMLVGEPLPGWQSAAADPPVLFIGGPVEPSKVICLGRTARPEEIGGWTPVLGPVGLVDLNLGPGHLRGLVEVRVFAGHAGWGPGQLEWELEEGAWLVVDAEAADVHTPRPATLWADVLARQSGPTAWLARYPDDARLN